MMAVVELWPPILFLLGGFLAVLLPAGALRSAVLCLVPIGAAVALYTGPQEVMFAAHLAGFDIVLARHDDLSQPFALLFCFGALLTLIFAFHSRSRLEQCATMLYAGGALATVLAGDLVTLFVAWEAMTLTSVFLIWARGTDGAYAAGFRYLLAQIASGLILLAGMVIVYANTASLAFDGFDLGTPGVWLILIAFGIKAGFPLCNNWMQDGYSSATLTGTVTLSIFTTKAAIYALARGFAGEDVLIWIGVAMALYPALYALIENDLRRLLIYSLNSQLGFMVVGIGIGGTLGVAGAVGYAMGSIVYHTLLIMGVSAVFYRAGTAKASELGGLGRIMPITCVLTLVGALSIASVPLFAGYAGKSVILSAVGKAHLFWPWLLLYLAAVSALAHSALRVMGDIFAGEKGPGVANTVREAPPHMLIAMALAALASIGFGALPHTLYALLPGDIDYTPFETGHLIAQGELILFGLLAFVAAQRLGIWPVPKRGINLDTDLVYRSHGYRLILAGAASVAQLWNGLMARGQQRVDHFIAQIYKSHGPHGLLARTWSAGAMVFWMALLLGVTLLLNYL